MIDSSLYYDQHAKHYLSTTLDVDMSFHYDLFLPHIPSGGRILDAGCGSGRDARYFLSKGYSVEAFDLSESMVQAACELTGLPVRNLSFQDMDYEDTFDGIWACASLLHVPMDELPLVFERMAVALKEQGVLYCSFKLQPEDFQRGGRHFTCFTTETFKQFVDDLPWFSLEELVETRDLRPGRAEEYWINAILRKVSVPQGD
ncbi:MAG: class I SAM-dependent methyltransferase [Sphaerochaeta sp.]